MTSTRVPPHNVDAEIAVLGAVLQDNYPMLSLLEIIDASSFYATRHQRIFAAMVSLVECGRAIDTVTLCDALERRSDIRASGGKDYIATTLLGGAPVIDNVLDYARIVAQLATRRKLLEQLIAAEGLLFDGEDTKAVAANLQSTLLSTVLESQREGFVRVKEDIWPLMQDLEDRARRGDAISENVVPTGYPEIDAQIAGGIERGELMVLMGVPGGCKTAAAMNMVMNNACPTTARPPIGALFVSAEMTRRKLHLRHLAMVSRVEFSTLRKASMRDDDYPKMARGAGILASAPLWVDQTPTPAIGDIIAKCRREKSEHPEIGFVVVDFIQLVQKNLEAKKMRDENRALELTTIAYQLKGLAKELDVSVLATCQCDASSVEKRDNKRPELSDARWSQGIREAADIMATTYRDRMYNPDPIAPDHLELGFKKIRDAEPFTEKLLWQGKYMLLSSIPSTGAAPGRERHDAERDY